MTAGEFSKKYRCGESWVMSLNALGDLTKIHKKTKRCLIKLGFLAEGTLGVALTEFGEAARKDAIAISERLKARRAKAREAHTAMLDHVSSFRPQQPAQGKTLCIKDGNILSWTTPEDLVAMLRDQRDKLTKALSETNGLLALLDKG